MPASNAYDSMSWKYISMASLIVTSWCFVAPSVKKHLPFIWWQHRTILNSTIFHVMPVSKWTPKLRVRIPNGPKSFSKLVPWFWDICIYYVYINDSSCTSLTNTFNHPTPEIEAVTPWRPACSNSAAWNGETQLYGHRNIAGPTKMNVSQILEVPEMQLCNIR